MNLIIVQNISCFEIGLMYVYGVIVGRTYDSKVEHIIFSTILIITPIQFFLFFNTCWDCEQMKFSVTMQLCISNKIANKTKESTTILTLIRLLYIVLSNVCFVVRFIVKWMHVQRNVTCTIKCLLFKALKLMEKKTSKPTETVSNWQPNKQITRDFCF